MSDTIESKEAISDDKPLDERTPAEPEQPEASKFDGDQTPQEDAAPALNSEAVVEAVLFSTDAPLSSGKIAQILGIGTAGDVKRHIESLNRRYTESGSAFRIEEIAGGFQMFTLPDYNPWIAKMHKARAESRLSQAALETLAIVAYKQPIMRADIEGIRGVAVGDMLVRLRDTKLIKIVGRAEEVGRPLLYGTTKRFLEVFGLSSLADLPKLEDEQSPAAVKLKVVQP